MVEQAWNGRVYELQGQIRSPVIASVLETICRLTSKIIRRIPILEWHLGVEFKMAQCDGGIVRLRVPRRQVVLLGVLMNLTCGVLSYHLPNMTQLRRVPHYSKPCISFGWGFCYQGRFRETEGLESSN